MELVLAHNWHALSTVCRCSWWTRNSYFTRFQFQML